MSGLVTHFEIYGEAPAELAQFYALPYSVGRSKGAGRRLLANSN
ncbi:hypothetical protein [Bradyrhizobium sp. CCGUVB23]|nr:hypothetical protein [Bradyrhizobium sp. CCGUVB23]